MGRSVTSATDTAPACRLAAVGLVCALGRDPAEAWARARDGTPPPLTPRADLVPGEVVHVAAVTAPLEEVPAALGRYASRTTALALTAVRQIEPQVRAAIRDFGPRRVGVVAGSSTSGVGEAEAAMRSYLLHGRFPAGLEYGQLELGGLATFLATYLGAAGPAYTMATACSSGAKALASARALLAAGVCDAVVAGGADAVCGMATGGFWSLQLVSPDRCAPFTSHRRGLTIGEGAAFFLLARRGGSVELLGAGESTEGYDMSAPEPTGTGAEAAMRAALLDAGLSPEGVTHVVLHGTGTVLNDAMESRAVFRLFGDKTRCSGLKPLVGHALGASGAIELALVWLSLGATRDGVYLPIPHVWDGSPAPDLPALRFAHVGERLATAGRPVVLLNSFGFGGNDCSLVVTGRGAC